LKYDERGRIATEGEGHQCSNPMYFAGGDARNGGAEVVNACAEAKKSAQAIHRFIQSK
jgi:glutamate synthase (NADPH/NADH) small chain